MEALKTQVSPFHDAAPHWSRLCEPSLTKRDDLVHARRNAVSLPPVTEDRAVQLRSKQHAERGDEKPYQGGDSGGERAVKPRVIRVAGDIPAEAKRGRE